MTHGADARNVDDELPAGLRDRLARERDVLVAYLFGSRARGTPGPLSDVDVVVLNDAPPSLAYRVIRDGRLLVSRDERARVRHWARTVDRYLDMAPMRQMLADGLHHRLEEGRFWSTLRPSGAGCVHTVRLASPRHSAETSPHSCDAIVRFSTVCPP